jgi:hypothetical protein
MGDELAGNFLFLSEIQSSGQRDNCVPKIYKDKPIFLL